MGRKAKKLKNYTTEQVEKLYLSDKNHRMGVKLFAILQLTRGYSSRTLAEFFGVSFKQICNWADRFDAEGIKGLHIKPGRGPSSRLTAEQLNQLKADLSKSPKEFGYNFDRWSGSLTGEHIRKKYKIEFKPAAIYNLIRKINLMCN